MRGLTVAIVTARFEDEICYPAWGKLAREALLGRRKDAYLSGEWLALCAALKLFPGVQHHVFHQLRALALQTRLPDRVIVIDRTLGCKSHGWEAMERALDEEDYPFEVLWTQPQVGPVELEDHPHLSVHGAVAALPPPSWTLTPARSRDKPYGNADKNTAVLLCSTDWLMMLDDSILPGFACCELAAQTCEQGKILLLGHRKLYQPTPDRDSVEIADSNWNESCDARVFGIWAMPLKYILGVNGFNTTLDGQRGQWDLELRYRMDLYAPNAGIEYVMHPHARTYEIEHDYPWQQAPRSDEAEWKKGMWRAPGPKLKTMREAIAKNLLAGNYAAEETEDEQEIFDDED